MLYERKSRNAKISISTLFQGTQYNKTYSSLEAKELIDNKESGAIILDVRRPD